ncbi:MAG TPA: hypothetical protein VK176_11595 [Phycisphaerales bacterium]|nr:hypothetical protein [Phycisphaerales bacterium]
MNTSTATGIGMKDLIAGLADIKAKLGTLPPPMDLHVTARFYDLLKSRFSVPDDSDIRQFVGAAVIVDLPPDSSVPFAWVARSIPQSTSERC